jgi:hypothetical protein
MKKPKKYCKNPDCEDEIQEYKSSKREYCGDYCRNHHGHKRRMEYNLEFTNFKNGMAANYKVLKFLQDAGILTEKLERIIKMGFDPKYLPQKNIDNEFSPNIAYYIIKDIIFGLDPETDTVIFYSPKKLNNEK